jgi:hypothetical protein
MTSVLAQFGPAGSIAQLVIAIILIAAVVGIGIVAVRVSGIQIPSWVIQIAWIVLVSLVAIFAIRFLMGWA